MQNELDEIVADLQQRVALRRASGAYPRGLEAELEAEFDNILTAMHGDTDGLNRLETDAFNLRDAVRHVVGTAASASRIPGGSHFHGAVGRLVGRHTNPLAASQRAVGETAAAAVDEIRQLLAAQATADERVLSGVIAAVLDRLAVLDELLAEMSSFERRLDALESAALRSS